MAYTNASICEPSCSVKLQRLASQRLYIFHFSYVSFRTFMQSYICNPSVGVRLVKGRISKFSRRTQNPALTNSPNRLRDSFGMGPFSGFDCRTDFSIFLPLNLTPGS